MYELCCAHVAVLTAIALISKKNSMLVLCGVDVGDLSLFVMWKGLLDVIVDDAEVRTHNNKERV